MGSESSLKLPVIDFSGLKKGTPGWDLVRNRVREALEEFGCFEAKFEKIPVELRNNIFAMAKDLFSLPLENKQRTGGELPDRGYVGQVPTLPLYETMAIDKINDNNKLQLFTQTMWPQGNITFSEIVQSFSGKVAELDQIVRRMILESFGLEKYMNEHMESTDYNFRFTKYATPQATDEPELGLPAHTDPNIISILDQNQVNGLEVQAQDGTWIHLKPSPNCLIVMLGDCLHAWLNGRLRSATHRVMMRGNAARYSIGLFSYPKEGYIVKAVEEVVDEDHPLLFKPFDLVGYTIFRYATAGGSNNENILKAYCGV